MSVKELIERLKAFPEEATVVMCMDWTEQENGPEGQWEDNLGEVTSAGPEAKHVYLLNENFK